MEIILDNNEKFTIYPEKTACFTGHRPEKIPFDIRDRFFRETVSSLLYLHSYEAVGRGYDTFICGMQRGIDVMAGLAVLRLREVFKNIRLVCVSPFRSEIKRRSGGDRDDYIYLKDNCDGFVVLSETYFQGCYLRRNDFMTDLSSLVIGAVADTNSGTGQTLRRAQKKGLDVEVINLSKFAADYFG